jgi:hypothetical protein
MRALQIQRQFIEKADAFSNIFKDYFYKSKSEGSYSIAWKENIPWYPEKSLDKEPGFLTFWT